MHNVKSLADMKRRRAKIVMLTAYDFLFASLVEKSGADIVLCGDSLGMVFNGHNTTIPVTMDEMIYHAKAVRRGAPETFLVVDMPFMSYQASKSQAVKNAGRIMKETGAQAVKIEAGTWAAPTVKAIVMAGIPVMGHIGTMPQSVNRYGGYLVSAADDKGKKELV
ncbi:MAG TPA: 3-methyl-2-oxobutanoate hydroxymethyltransferase, partial [Candidatus Goldiibacteriota bacterium]|nr:3-methyl-2-oxobutanoate hydroxymethyltransferase [Candidatus Goldiibacteriota bacterium]